MAHYRLYLLNETKHVVHAIDLDCDDDQAAIQSVIEHGISRPTELWSGTRVVRSFNVAPAV